MDLPYSEAMRSILRNEFNPLLSYDQLNRSRRQGSAFDFFTEGMISFPPTYKFDPGSSQYDTRWARPLKLLILVFFSILFYK